MNSLTTRRDNRSLLASTCANALAGRLSAVPLRRTGARDETCSMSTPQGFDRQATTMRLVGRTARLMFSRRDPDRARALAMELARTTAAFTGLDDPVRTWDVALQLDRGLGRARRLHRLVNSPVWQSDHGTHTHGKALEDSAADYLFAAVMNLVYKVPLSDEAHLFRLWYLASRAVNAPDNATRLFGNLRQLPAHQQLAAGARMMETLPGPAPALRGPDPRPMVVLDSTD